MAQDLRSKDQAAQDRIEYLEYQPDAADIENEELKQKIIDRDVLINQFIQDRTYCP